MDNHYAQADLRFFLPIEPQQSVLVVGDAPILVNALEAIAKVTAVKTWEESAHFVPHSFHHVLIPYLPKSVAPDDILRLLQPDGWLCVGVANAQRLQRLRFLKQRPSSARQLSYAQLQGYFPNQQAIYGIHDSLRNPQYFVPLENP